MATADNLKALAGDQPLRSAILATVVGSGDDPTKVIVTDQNSQWSVSCLDGYRRRTAGDVVLVLQLSGGDWVVLGKISADQTAVSAVTWGVGSPPPRQGLRKVSQVWQGVNPDGSVALYTDMTSAAPAPATVPAADAATWVDSSGTRTAIVSSDTQLAAWYYGTTIGDACSGKLVTSMKVTLTRLTDSGPDTSVPVRLGLHALTAFGQPTVTDQWDPQVQLAPGQTSTITVPDAQATLLGNGTAKGIVATGTDAYAEYATTAPILITFG